MIESLLKNKARLAVGALFFIHGTCFSSWGSRIPTIQAQLGLSEAELGTVLFSVPIGSLSSMPVATYLTKRLGSKSTLSLAICFYILCLVAIALAKSWEALSLTLILFGFFSNMVNVSLNTQAVALESILARTVMSSLHGLWSLAGFFGAAFGAFMIAFNIAPVYHFICTAILASFIFLCVHKNLLQNKREKTGHKLKLKLPSKTLSLLGVIAFASMICEGAMFDWSGVYFKKVIQVSPSLVGLGYSSFMFTMALARFFADHYINKFGSKSVLSWCGLTIAFGLILAVAHVSLWSGVLGFFLVGAGTSAVVPLVFSLAGKVPESSPSDSIAIVSTIGFLGFLIGPPIIGHLAQISSLRLSFSLMALMGFSITLLGREVRRLK